MRAENFCYWLKGYLELSSSKISCIVDLDKKEGLTASQVKCIENHLDLVFKHEIDPAMGDDKHQKDLNEIHSKPKFDRGSGNQVYRC